MDKIRIVMLGGQDESYKTMTAVEINDDIFVIEFFGLDEEHPIVVVNVRFHRRTDDGPTLEICPSDVKSGRRDHGENKKKNNKISYCFLRGELLIQHLVVFLRRLFHKISPNDIKQTKVC